MVAIIDKPKNQRFEAIYMLKPISCKYVALWFNYNSKPSEILNGHSQHMSFLHDDAP